MSADDRWMALDQPVTAPTVGGQAATAPSAADMLAQALADWSAGKPPMAATLNAVARTARALLVEHEQMRGVHVEQMAQLTVKTGRVLAERGEEIAELTVARDRPAGELAQASRVVASLGEIRDYLQGLTDRLVADLTAARAELDEERARVGRLDAMLQDRDRQAEGLTAERDRLRQREAWRMARTYDAMAAEVAQARVERDVLAGQVQRMRALADRMEAEAPKPAPGGFFADEVRRVLDGPGDHSDDSAAGGPQDGAAERVQAVRDLAVGWILTGEAAAKTHGRAVIVTLDGGAA